MQITPPFGYSEIVPLYKHQRVRLPATGSLPEFCRRVNAVPISYSEFSAACRDYPLVFVSTDQGRSFTPMAVLGVAGGENLYLGRDGWDPSVYLPAYVRRYPFCMARVTIGAVEQSERLICVEKSFLAEDGERLFDDGGAPLPRWEPLARLLQEYEIDLERTREMCAILADYGLFESFSLQAPAAQAGPINLGGMYRIAERKIESLNAAQHRNLIRKGAMGRIYAHLISLENFSRLVARRDRTAKAAP